MVEVRALRADDFEQFCRLMNGFFGYSAGSEANHDELTMLFEAAIDPSKNIHFLVACDADRLIGCLSLTFAESSYKVAPFAWADDFYVEPNARGSGVGSALMQAARELAQSKRCSNILVGVGNGESETLRFYDRAGFKDMSCKLMTLPLT